MFFLFNFFLVDLLDKTKGNRIYCQDIVLKLASVKKIVIEQKCLEKRHTHTQMESNFVQAAIQAKINGMEIYVAKTMF